MPRRRNPDSVKPDPSPEGERPRARTAVLLDMRCHQPLKLGILLHCFRALRNNEGRVEFVDLRARLGITNANLGSAIRFLIGEDLLDAHRGFKGTRTNTTYALTPIGIATFEVYLKHLLSVLDEAGALPDDRSPGKSR